MGLEAGVWSLLFVPSAASTGGTRGLAPGAEEGTRSWCRGRDTLRLQQVQTRPWYFSANEVTQGVRSCGRRWVC